MVWPFGKRKSKARHRSPIQALVVSTQGLARAHSLVSLTENPVEDKFDTRSLPDNSSIVPQPSTGICGSRPPKKSLKTNSSIEDDDFTTGFQKRKPKPPRVSKVDHVLELQQQRMDVPGIIPRKEQLVHHRASIHQEPSSIHQDDDSRNTVDSAISVPSFPSVESEPSIHVEARSRRKSIKSPKEPIRKKSSLDSFLEMPVDPAVSQLQHVLTSLQAEVARLNTVIAKKDCHIEKLNKDVQDVILGSADLKRDNLFFAAEVKELQVKNEKLAKEAFDAKYMVSKIVTDKEEAVLEVERKVRDLEYKAEFMKLTNEKLSRESAKSVSRIDHTRIISSIQAKFDETIKSKDIEILEFGINAAKSEERIIRAQEAVYALMKDKETTMALIEIERQKTSDERARVAPLVVQNESLEKRNEMYKYKYDALTRDLDSANRQIHVQERVFTTRKDNGSQSVTSMKEMFLSVQDDWRSVAGLLNEVQEENRNKSKVQYESYVKGIHDVALDFQQREMDLSFREDKARHAMALSSLRDSHRY